MLKKSNKTNKESLGDICRGGIAHAFNNRRTLGASPDPERLARLNERLKIEAEALRGNIEYVMERTHIGYTPAYSTILPSPCEKFDIETAKNFEEILDICAQEDVSIQVMPMLVRAGTQAAFKPGVGIERKAYYAIGLCLTVDPSRKFAGLERKENKMMTSFPPTEPAP